MHSSPRSTLGRDGVWAQSGDRLLWPTFIDTESLRKNTCMHLHTVYFMEYVWDPKKEIHHYVLKCITYRFNSILFGCCFNHSLWMLFDAVVFKRPVRVSFYFGFLHDGSRLMVFMVWILCLLKNMWRRNSLPQETVQQPQVWEWQYDNCC